MSAGLGEQAKRQYTFFITPRKVAQAIILQQKELNYLYIPIQTIK